MKRIISTMLAILLVACLFISCSDNEPQKVIGEKAKTYTVTLNSNGGSSVKTQIVSEGKNASRPANPTKAGFEFKGWFVDSEFTTELDFDAAIGDNVTGYAKWSELPYLCFTANVPESSVFLGSYGSNIIQSLEVTVDDGLTWQEYVLGEVEDIVLHNVGDKVYFRRADENKADKFSSSLDDYLRFSITGSVAGSGNVMSLVDKSCETTTAESCYFINLFKDCVFLTSAPELPATTLGDSCYAGMFSGCINLTKAPELPATTLADSCYAGMFSGCTSLTEAPELPVTTLADSCYADMFSGCTNLAEAPELPATTLADSCYAGMFSGCTSLAEAPELPVTTLAKSCYSDMFSGCTNLTSAPELPATTLAKSCYSGMFSGCTNLTEAPELPATDLAASCYDSMFKYCTKLTSAPELPATTLDGYCYSSMFSGCTSLTEAPELPATTLATSCYQKMFDGCTNLTSAPALPATTLAANCYESMFWECTNLTSVPALPATTLATGCYQKMFKECSFLKFSTIPSDECTNEYRVPVSGIGNDNVNWNREMFKGTEGSFTSDPEINATYYTNATVIY